MQYEDQEDHAHRDQEGRAEEGLCFLFLLALPAEPDRNIGGDLHGFPELIDPQLQIGVHFAHHRGVQHIALQLDGAFHVLSFYATGGIGVIHRSYRAEGNGFHLHGIHIHKGDPHVHQVGDILSLQFGITKLDLVFIFPVFYFTYFLSENGRPDLRTDLPGAQSFEHGFLPVHIDCDLGIEQIHIGLQVLDPVHLIGVEKIIQLGGHRRDAFEIIALHFNIHRRVRGRTIIFLGHFHAGAGNALHHFADLVHIRLGFFPVPLLEFHKGYLYPSQVRLHTAVIIPRIVGAHRHIGDDAFHDRSRLSG